MLQLSFAPLPFWWRISLKLCRKVETLWLFHSMEHEGQPCSGHICLLKRERFPLGKVVKAANLWRCFPSAGQWVPRVGWQRRVPLGWAVWCHTKIIGIFLWDPWDSRMMPANWVHVSPGLGSCGCLSIIPLVQHQGVTHVGNWTEGETLTAIPRLRDNPVRSSKLGISQKTTPE